ncbi:MAG: DUF1752 domain-containing protein, partial [Cytophagaceae bacterium]
MVRYFCSQSLLSRSLLLTWVAPSAVFNKISDAMEDGKRLENLSWRLWNRETFVCSRMPRARKNIPLPALSSSVSSSDES